ncbi:MAG: hypothetical protein SNJ80_07760, partial [Anaerolinea sp.]
MTGLFILFRQMERWLHQHIFKLGWLLTRNSRVTTVLYYTLFFPGILLHEVVSWLVAGMLNVHATQSIQWPQSQEVGELRLNFVRINPNIPAWKRFVIALSPLVVGMLLTWHIAENVFQLEVIFAMMSTGSLVDVGAAFERLLATPDFWLWFYLLFTVSNTMFASTERSISNARSLLSAVMVIVAAIILVGATSATFSYVSSPFESALSVLSELLVLLIAVNFVATIFLGTIESAIERFSDHSVTFRGGRMEMVTRQQLIDEREKERARAQRRAARAAAPSKTGPVITSVYKLAFPIPGGPTRETGEQLKLDVEAQTRTTERPALPKPTSKPAVIHQPKPPAKPAQLARIPSITPIESLVEKSTAEPTKPVEETAEPVTTSDVASPSAPPASEQLASEPVHSTEDEAEVIEATSVTPPNSPFSKPAASAFTTTEDDEAADAPPAKPAVTARPFASPFSKPAASAFTTTEDNEAADAPPAKPAVPARPFASPFSKPAAIAFTTTEDDEAADAPPAKPAVPARPFASPFS